METRVVVWLDSAVADFHDESIIIVENTGDVEMLRRMSRAAFRQFIDSSARMLAEADRKPSTVKRFIRRKPGNDHN